MSEATHTRLHYREHQLLRTADLRDEQGYRRAMQRRHDLSLHSWGIAHGLALQPSDDGVTLQPGVAVDGYGRVMMVQEALLWPAAALDELFQRRTAHPQDQLAAWLVFGLLPDAQDRARVHEVTCVWWTVHGADDPIDPRKPPYVPSAAWSFAAADVLAKDEDELSAWPVLLGCVMRIGETSTSFAVKENQPLLFVQAPGASITTPDGKAQIQLEPESLDDPDAFVFRAANPATKGMTEQLRVNRDGDVRVQGDVAIHLANVKTPSLHLEPLESEPKQALPWRIYRVNVARKKTDETQPDLPPLRQLRIELFHPDEKGSPERYQLEIGREPECGFAKLIVKADGSVEIGNLEVADIISAPIAGDITNAEFQQTLTGEWLKGIEAGLRGLETLNGSLVGPKALLVKFTQSPPKNLVIHRPAQFKFKVTNGSKVALRDVRFAISQTLYTTPNQSPHPIPGTPQIIGSLAAAATSAEQTGRLSAQPNVGFLIVFVTFSAIGPGGNIVSANEYFVVKINKK